MLALRRDGQEGKSYKCTYPSCTLAFFENASLHHPCRHVFKTCSCASAKLMGSILRQRRGNADEPGLLVSVVS